MECFRIKVRTARAHDPNSEELKNYVNKLVSFIRVFLAVQRGLQSVFEQFSQSELRDAPIPNPILGLELLELVGFGLGIDWNWSELRLQLAAIGLELVRLGMKFV